MPANEERVAAPARRSLRGAGSLALALALAGCGNSSMPTWNFADIMPKSGVGAVARLSPKNGSPVRGTVTFVQRGDKVGVSAVINDLSPGPHSMYIHEVGNCSSPNAASAGRVWALVGAPPGRARVGNLPELMAGSEGTANVVAELRGISVGDGSPLDIIGHSIVVHAGVDPDPRPEFGVRNGWLACGIIERQGETK
jgi:superoxide dismutase, Cu-Zn family